ncbi:MAG: 6,7-dimethyl-8-ribityllumazine synthase [Microthrixaceae bacterium]|nr:6,7-dimethyl-8-ribityllumazine synthase [Microthrixaceae bacterium]
MSAAHPTDSLPTLAFVRAGWHAELVDRAQQGFLEVATAERAVVETFEVPGAFELPLHAQTLAETGRFDAIVAAGLVVDGGIYRHEFVADAVIGGLMRVQLDVGVPVLSCVLTPHHFHEHDDHQRFFADHLVGKGREAADACLAILAARAGLASGTPSS